MLAGAAFKCSDPFMYFGMTYHWTLKIEKRRNRKKRKLRKQQKTPHINLGKGATWEEKPLQQRRRKQSVRIRRVAGRQASRPLLIGLKVRRMLKITSGLNKLMCTVHRMSMELGSKFLDSLWIKAETFQMNQSVRNVNNTPYTLESDMKNIVSCNANSQHYSLVWACSHSNACSSSSYTVSLYGTLPYHRAWQPSIHTSRNYTCLS